jgi:phosphate transport system substrate-binding protein
MRNPIHISIVIALVFAGLIGATGCGDRSAETPTRGKVAFTVSEELLPLMREAEKQYEELYPEALIELRPRHDREAITDLFNDSVKLIVTARPLNGEERAVQKKFKIEVNEFRIALDAVVFIVNTANDVSRLTIPQADSIFTGAVMDWGLLGWRGAPGKMTLYLPDKNAAAYEVVAGFLPPGKVFVTPGKICSTSRESLGIAGKYFSPHQAYIYKGYYPVVRDVYIYSTPDSYGVSTGFTSFMTSAAGQKIVQNQGLVPATMPVRLVQLRNDEL